MEDGIMDNTKLINDAIAVLAHASAEEKEALAEIFDVEGFGGREDRVRDATSAQALANERLAWLREQREEGLR
jgi:hypothetical protein